MKRVTVADIILSIVVIILIAATLVPALGRAQRAALDAKCQSNLRRWGEAMAAYTADHCSFHPGNRLRFATQQAVVPLSQPTPIPPATEPPSAQYGPNWVEALYPYIKSSAAKTDQDWRSFRRCPNATDRIYPPTTTGADLHWAMTYVFNSSLIEQPRGIIRDGKKLMLIRELGRLTVSTVRPSNGWACVGTTTTPLSPFLHGNDIGIGSTADECKLHGDGSYILFADGHVRHFTVDFYPDTLSVRNCYDSATYQWYNFAPGSGAAAPYLKSIAITP